MKIIENKKRFAKECLELIVVAAGCGLGSVTADSFGGSSDYIQIPAVLGGGIITSYIIKLTKYHFDKENKKPNFKQDALEFVCYSGLGLGAYYLGKCFK